MLGKPDPESGPPGTIGGSVVGKLDPLLVPEVDGGTGNLLGTSGTGIEVIELLPLVPELLVVGLLNGAEGSDGAIGFGGVTGLPGTV